MQTVKIFYERAKNSSTQYFVNLQTSKVFPESKKFHF